MRYAVIDNSTITATQRLLGDIEAVNKIAIDGDIAAFESLIQEILFYDEIFYIDDYKSEFKEQRKLSFPHFIPISTDEIPYDDISKSAYRSIDDLTLKIEGGDITPNEIGKFLKELKLNTTFVWNMRSSAWFLTMKMLEGVDGLDIQKYSRINDMIFHELSANSEIKVKLRSKEHYKILDSDGNPIPKNFNDKDGEHEISPQVTAFAASLNWLSLRTSFYTYLSYIYDLDAILHPIRSAFQMSIAGKLGLPNATFKPILDRFSNETINVAKDIVSASDPVVTEMRIPLFSAWLIEKTGDPRKIIDAAYNLRTEKPFSDARKLLIELEDTAKERSRKDYLRQVNILINSIKKTGDTLRAIYGTKTGNGMSISPLINIINIVGKIKGLPSIPNIPIKVPIPNKLMEIGLRGGFKGVCRSVIQDLVAVERLGGFHDKLTSAVRFRDGKENVFLAKTEHIRFRGRRSHWTKPM